MAASPPELYTSVADAKNPKSKNQIANVVGMVVEWASATHSSRDMFCTFSISDRSASVYENRLKIRLFDSQVEQLPSGVQVGDLLVAKDVKIMDVRGDFMGVSSSKSKWAVVRCSKPKQKPNRRIPAPRPTLKLVDVGPKKRVKEGDEVLGDTEIEYCTDLWEWWETRGGLAAAHGVNNKDFEIVQKEMNKNIRRRHSLIKDIQLDGFYDIYCFIQKTWESYSSFTIWVSDFTENQELEGGEHADNLDIREPTHLMALGAGAGNRDDAGTESYKWYEKRIEHYSLQVVLWDEYVKMAKTLDLRVGKYVLLKNLRIKRGKGGKMEGAISKQRNDNVVMEYIKVLHHNDDAVALIIKRRKAFEKQTSERRVALQEEEERLKKEREEAGVKVEMERRSELNKQLTCGGRATPTTSIDRITKMLTIDKGADFFNRIYRTDCRVVDFRPFDLKDFCRRVEGKNESACPNFTQESMNIDSSGKPKPPPKWYWCFELDVVGKDSPTHLTIHVDDKAGRYLLSMEPFDLRAPENYNKFVDVREKLFVLWGSLQETKQRDHDMREQYKQKVLDIQRRLESGEDERFLSRLMESYEQERQKTRKPTLYMNDPRVSNKFFACCIKEFGERSSDDDEPVRKFVLDGTTIAFAGGGGDLEMENADAMDYVNG